MEQITSHQLNRRSNFQSILKLLGFLTLLFTVNLLIALQPAQAALEPTPYEQRLIVLTNHERANFGLPELHQSDRLQQAAAAKASDMLEKDYFDHLTPTGKTPWEFIKEADYIYIKAGENLAIDFSDLNDVVPAWMASPSHRANILKSDYREIGIAVLTGEFKNRATTVVVQIFGTRPSVFFSAR